MNYKRLLPILALFALSVFLFSNSAYALDEEQYVIKNIDSNHRYVSHSGATQIDSTHTKYIVSQQYQYKEDDVFVNDPSRHVEENIYFTKISPGKFTQYHTLTVHDEDIVQNGYNPMTYTSTAGSAHIYYHAWLADTDQLDKQADLYTAKTTKYFELGLIATDTYTGHYETYSYAPMGTIYRGENTGKHYMILSRDGNNNPNYVQYFNGLVRYYHPTNSYQVAIERLTQELPVYQQNIPDNDQGNVVGQTWYDQYFIMEYKDTGVAYHELCHQLHQTYTEAQCDQYAYNSGHPIVFDSVQFSFDGSTDDLVTIPGEIASYGIPYQEGIALLTNVHLTAYAEPNHHNGNVRLHGTISDYRWFDGTNYHTVTGPIDYDVTITGDEATNFWGAMSQSSMVSYLCWHDIITAT